MVVTTNDVDGVLAPHPTHLTSAPVVPTGYPVSIFYDVSFFHIVLAPVLIMKDSNGFNPL